MAWWIPLIQAAASMANSSMNANKPKDPSEVPEGAFGRLASTSADSIQSPQENKMGSLTSFESAVNEGMGSPGGAIGGEDPGDIIGGTPTDGGGFADIMGKLAMGAKMAQSMRPRGGGAGPLVNFGGAANAGFGGAPVSQGFIQPQKRRQGTTFGQLAQRLRR